MNSRIVGALWARQKDGMEYFSGVLTDLHGNINIAVFPNNRKEAENQPDFNIVISFGDRKEPESSQKEVSEPAKKNGKSKTKPKKVESDIPF